MSKTLGKKVLTLLLSVSMLLSAMVTAIIPAKDTGLQANAAESNYICLGYVADWMFQNQSNLSSIDFSKLTHVNFAFSLINSSTYLPTIASPNKLNALVSEIKRQQADTKVLLSIGGWEADYFCEASNSDARRAAFAQECANFITTYGIDGIDLDWEYPGSTDAGISACANCKTDYTKLCQAIRSAIGNDKLLTMAGGASSYRASQIECTKLAGILDFVNLMNYDYNSTNHASFGTTKTAAAAWANAGFSKKQINIGIPFYGRSSSNTYNWMEYWQFIPQYVLNGKAVITTAEDESYAMIDKAKFSFDTPEQIRKKMLWLKSEGYLGAMVWEICQDYNEDLLNTMHSNLNGDGTYNSPYIPIPGIGGGTTITVNPVTNLAVSSADTTSITFTWAASSNASSYDIYLNNTFAKNITALTYTAEGLSPATSYTIKVIAKDSKGNTSAAVLLTGATKADPSDIELGVGEYTTTFPNGAKISEILVHKNYYGEFSPEPFEQDGVWLNTYPVGALVYYNGAYYENYAVSSAWGDGWEPDRHSNWHRILLLAEGEDPNPQSTAYALFKVGTLKAYHSFYGVQETDMPTLIVNGRAFVSMRFGAGVVDASCDYTESAGSMPAKILLTYPEYKVEFTVEGTTVNIYQLDGTLFTTSEIPADQVPTIIDGRTYLPARVLGQVSCVTGRTYIYYLGGENADNLGEFVVYTSGEATNSELLTMVKEGNDKIA